ncbi:MAG: hybrid sensor histidine kinase/response regulator [Deltaproteobacteria bacterium]|nr:hybrid sensor histidine kinase/response regulator [Deltaproteobacteria bacterium]
MTHTVLAVDDEPANQRAVRRALMDDCTVLTAGSGAEGLAILDAEPVAMVISDHRMPGMTGAEFLAETVDRHPQVIRVVLTGYAAVDVLLDAINRGHVYHVLGKPWVAAQLRLVVRRGLERFDAARERDHLLDALRDACARAEREAEQKTRLLALAAHELGTPVHLLLNALDLLDEADAGGEPWLGMARRAADWLARGAAQLHTAAQLNREPLRLAPQRVALAPLVGDAVAAVRAAAFDRRLDLIVDGGNAELDADPAWLTQALLALLSNAVRFTPDGGQVRVGIACGAGWAEISVADSGIGIAAELLPHCFEPFSTAGGDLLLHGSGRFAFGARGLGLGLATVRGIALAHGGAVDVESTVGRGSTFRLRLPRTEH